MVRTDPGVKKDTILITVERYLNEVDPAVRHLFDGIGTYLEKWRQIGSVFTEDRDELARVMKRLED